MNICWLKKSIQAYRPNSTKHLPKKSDLLAATSSWNEQDVYSIQIRGKILLIVLLMTEFSKPRTLVLGKGRYTRNRGTCKKYHFQILDPALGPGGGVLLEKLGGGVRPASQNPYPIYDQNHSLPYLWPDQKFETLWPSNQNPVQTNVKLP